MNYLESLEVEKEMESAKSQNKTAQKVLEELLKLQKLVNLSIMIMTDKKP